MTEVACLTRDSAEIAPEPSLLRKLKLLGSLDVDGPQQAEEVQRLIDGGLARLEVTAFPWGVGFRVVSTGAEHTQKD